MKSGTTINFQTLLAEHDKSQVLYQEQANRLAAAEATVAGLQDQLAQAQGQATTERVAHTTEVQRLKGDADWSRGQIDVAREEGRLLRESVRLLEKEMAISRDETNAHRQARNNTDALNSRLQQELVEAMTRVAEMSAQLEKRDRLLRSAALGNRKLRKVYR